MPGSPSEIISESACKRYCSGWFPILGKSQGFPTLFESGPQSSLSQNYSRSFFNSLFNPPKILSWSTYAQSGLKSQTPSPLLATSSNCTLSAPVLASGSAPRVLRSRAGRRYWARVSAQKIPFPPGSRHRRAQWEVRGRACGRAATKSPGHKSPGDFA